MRLNNKDIAAIKEVTRIVFGDKATVTLFGSRTGISLCIPKNSIRRNSIMTNKESTVSERLKVAIEKCRIHLQRMQYALNQSENLFPLIIEKHAK